jgi:hybrid cluster-associated redox disulfide protein
LKQKVTPQSVVADILSRDIATQKYFAQIGMHCLGCPSAKSETLMQACRAHGADVDALIKTLNAHFVLSGK